MLYRNQYTPYKTKRLNVNNENNEENDVSELKKRITTLENKLNENMTTRNAINYDNIQDFPTLINLDNMKRQDNTANERHGIENFLMELINSSKVDLDKKYSTRPGNNTNFNISNESYNENWENDFKNQNISLEDDGIYEYIEGDDNMKYEYYNGEIPRTKIMKVSSKSGPGAIVKSKEKVISDEIGQLRNESAIVQKAWLENNRKIKELTNIIELQDNQIKELKNNGTYNNQKYDENKMIYSDNTPNKINPLEERIIKLEKINSKIINENSSINILKEENEKLKQIILEKGHEKPTHVQEVLENNKNKKRKQAHFYVIKEYSTPKITKHDINHKK